MPRITHFEIPANDPEQSMAFYERVFGWTFEKFSGFDYWIARTGPDDWPGINGAIMKRRDPMQPMTNAIDVPNLDDAIRSIKASGGQIVVEKMAVPSVGWVAYFKDPDGVILGVWQSDPNAK